ncbi:MAG: hypothetical protein WCH65_05110 [bacterium]
MAGIIIAIREATLFKKNHEKERDDMKDTDPNYIHKQIFEAFPLNEDGSSPLCTDKHATKKVLNKLIDA